MTLIALESPEELPASPWEVEEARAEGIEILHRLGVKQILSQDGQVTGLELKAVARVFDEQGRFAPTYFDDRLTTREADVVIMAIGQKADLKFITAADGINLTPRGLIEADPDTLATSRAGVFAGGDVVTGPWIAIGAVAAGREAAISIDRYLDGLDLKADREAPLRPIQDGNWNPIPKDQPKAPREQMPELPQAEWTKGFKELNLGFTEAQAQAEAARCINCGACSECMQCVEACQAGAIAHEQQPRTQTLEVGAVILAPGFKTFDAKLKPEYGYGRYPNVITSLEFERLLSATGPCAGHVKRPSDQADPKKIAWIQCVGSRDASIGREYCSYVCCMYAAKQSIIAKEHDHGVSPTIFFIDFRAQGKGFDRYYERARDEHGVRLIRSMISRVTEDPRTHNLELTYVDEDGRIRMEEFDLVVLSVGLTPHPAATKMAQVCNIATDQWGFVKSPPFKMVETSREGIYTCGVFQSPKDIPETVGQASAAAGAAAALLSEVRGTLLYQGDLSGGTGDRRGGAAHRRLRVPLRHQHRRGGGRGPGERVCPHPAGGGLCRPLHLHLRHRQPFGHAAGDRGASSQPGGGGFVQPPDPRTPLPGQPAKRPASTSTCLRWPTSGTRIPGCTRATRRRPPPRPRSWSRWRWAGPGCWNPCTNSPSR